MHHELHWPRERGERGKRREEEQEGRQEERRQRRRERKERDKKRERGRGEKHIQMPDPDVLTAKHLALTAAAEQAE